MHNTESKVESHVIRIVEPGKDTQVCDVCYVHDNTQNGPRHGETRSQTVVELGSVPVGRYPRVQVEHAGNREVQCIHDCQCC